MNSYIAITVFSSMLAISNGLQCWKTTGDGYVAMMAHTTITMETCESSAKSCSKLAYQVVDWGDYYFKLGCSETEAKAETEVAKGPSGKMTEYYCKEDFCNSSGTLTPVLGLISLAAILNYLKN